MFDFALFICENGSALLEREKFERGWLEEAIRSVPVVFFMLATTVVERLSKRSGLIETNMPKPFTVPLLYSQLFETNVKKFIVLPYA